MRLVVDANGLLHTSIHTRKLTTPLRSPYGSIFIGGVYGFLQSLRSLLDHVTASEVVICWDGGWSRRDEIYPEYKANRDRTDDEIRDIRTQRSILISILEHLPVVQIWEDGIEADDCIGVLTEFLKLEEVVVATMDRDLFQLQGGGQRLVFVNYRGRHHSLEGKPGAWWLAHRVLVGDVSDNIKGVHQIGPVTAKKLLAEHKTLKGVVGYTKSEGKLGAMTAKQAISVVKRNLKLMRLGYLLTPEEQTSILNQYRHCRMCLRTSQARLTELFLNLGFTSLLRRMSSFISPFRDLERWRPKHEAEAELYRRRIREAHSESNQERGATIAKTRRIRKVVGRDLIGPGETRGRGRRLARGPGPVGDTPGKEARQRSDAVPKAVRSKRYPRIRKVLADEDAEECGPRGAAGVVPADHGRSAGAGVEARRGRAGKPLAGFLASGGVADRQAGTRAFVITTLTLFCDDEGWAWLETQPVERLEFVREMINRVEGEQTTVIKRSEADTLQEIFDDFMGDMPDWMQTKKEEQRGKADRAVAGGRRGDSGKRPGDPGRPRR